MKKITYLVLFILAGCFTKRSEVVVYMENNSDLDSVINIKTLINGKFYKVVPVKRNTIAVKLVPLIVKFPDKMDTVKLTFINSNRGDSSSCVVRREILSPKTWVHVNFNQVVFRKGRRFYDRILERDTLMGREFYSEIINW
jgi:hypothetical protein